MVWCPPPHSHSRIQDDPSNAKAAVGWQSSPQSLEGQDIIAGQSVGTGESLGDELALISKLAQGRGEVDKKEVWKFGTFCFEFQRVRVSMERRLQATTALVDFSLKKLRDGWVTQRACLASAGLHLRQ